MINSLIDYDGNALLRKAISPVEDNSDCIIAFIAIISINI